jgi:hypothetical protein
VSIAFCAEAVPHWVAFQDGDGEWTEAQPSTTGSLTTYQATLTADRAAVATTRLLANGLASVVVQYGKPTELGIVSVTNPLLCAGAGSRALRGTVAGLGADDQAEISAGLETRTAVLPNGDPGFTLHGLIPGPQEILASRLTRIDPATTVVTRLILRRVDDLPDGTTLPVFDFNSAESFAPATGTVTIEGLGPEGALANTVLRTPHGESVVSFGLNDIHAATRSFLAIPEAQLAPGDLQLLSVGAAPVTTGDSRTTALYFRAPGEQTLTLGPVIIRPAFSTVATTPALRVRAHFVSQAEYDRQTSITFQAGSGNLFTVSMTAAYAALTGGEYDLVVPDLSHAAGFDPAWALHQSPSVFWSASRVGGTVGVGLDATATEGATSRSAIAFGTLPN